jgi:O-antigen/teichoic acid export membrane protein
MPPSLRKNIVSLYGVQLAAYVVPLATLPWLTRVLGPAGFGRIAFCNAVISYFVLFADYGFNYSATRAVALHCADRAARSRVFWNTLVAKALLATIGFPMLLLLTALFADFAAERSLLMVTYLTVVGTVLTPTWYFQGTERQTVLSGITIAVRVLSVPVVFLCVRSAQDVQLAATISCGLPVIGGMLCMFFLYRDRQIDAFRFAPRELLRPLRDGWHLFISTASISLYGATNSVVLGLIAGPAAVGHYSAAEKLVQATQGMLLPINQSVFPRVSRLFGESRESAFALIRKVLRVQGAIALALSLLLVAVAPLLIRIVFGAAYEATIDVLRWLALMPFLIGLSNVLGVHTMIAMGMNREVSRILISAGAINIVLLLVLTPRFGAVGAAMSVVTTEFFVTTAMAVVLRRSNVPIFRVPAVT